jgi:hypothetical protein
MNTLIQIESLCFAFFPWDLNAVIDSLARQSKASWPITHYLEPEPQQRRLAQCLQFTPYTW